MTIGTDQDSTVQTSRTQEMATAAHERGTEVAETAKDAGRDVAREAATQASAVASEAKNQLDTMMHQAKNEMRNQVDMRGRQAADGLMGLAGQLSALTEGRREDAGRLGDIVSDAQQRLQNYAERLQQRGPQAIVDDVSAFARRRPGMFLMGAAATGFMVGRLVRAGAQANKEQSGDGRSVGSWNGAWQPPTTSSAMVPGTQPTMSGATGPSREPWPSTGPTGSTTGSQYGMETP